MSRDGALMLSSDFFRSSLSAEMKRAFTALGRNVFVQETIYESAQHPDKCLTLTDAVSLQGFSLKKNNLKA